MSNRPPEENEAISFTGERFIPEEVPEESHLALEHRARYDFALNFVGPDDIVLDCASGAGYGSYALALKAARVVGVDISPDAVAHASREYRASNLRYCVGDAQTLAQFADGTFTVVTSFETIEHLRNQNEYLRNIRRVLSREGTFVLSMPNRDFYAEAKLPPGVANPYHINELSIRELKALLTEFFPRYTLYGQNFYMPTSGGHALQSLLLRANRLAAYRWARKFVPSRMRNRVVERIGAAPKSDISELDEHKGIPTNILAVCR